MRKYIVWLRIDGRLVKKEVSASSEEQAVKKAVKESSWFGNKVDVISCTGA